MNGIMSNVTKEIKKSFIVLANMAKELISEIEQRSVQHELERLFPSTRGVGRGGGSREFHRVGSTESSAFTSSDTNTSFATPSTTKQTITEICE